MEQDITPEDAVIEADLTKLTAEPVPEPVPAEPIAAEQSNLTTEQVREIIEGNYYTTKEVAIQTNFSIPWITALCLQGRIRAIKPLGGQWRIPNSEFERIMKEGIPPLPRVEKPTEEPTRIEVPPEQADKVAPKRKEKQEGKEEETPWWLLSFGKKRR